MTEQTDNRVPGAYFYPRNSAADLYRRIERKLGLREVDSDIDLAWMVEHGLPVNAMETLALHGMAEKEIYRLIVSRRALNRHRERHEALARDESDRAMRIARVTALAEEIFGDEVKAARWLRKPWDDASPRTGLDLLVTEAGAWIVEEKLIQIDEGIFA